MRSIDVYDVPDEVRTLIAECEVAGKQTLFERDGRKTAVLVSWDEYLALRETIAIANDPRTLAAIRKADAEGAREEPSQPFPELERIRMPRSLASRLQQLPGAVVHATLARLDGDPISGAPLFEPLRGLWSAREGVLRVIYRVMPEVQRVVIVSIAVVEEP